MKTRLSVLAIAIYLTCTCSSFAQSVTLLGEVGSSQNKLGDGSSSQNPIYGLNLQFVVGGSASKNTGVLFPMGFEIRSDSNLGSGYFDLLGYGDVAFRVHAVSFGGGINFPYLARANAADPRCPKSGGTLGFSCLAGADAGKREFESMYGMGLSGMGKYSFGPQGRAFIQGRYIHYDKSLIAFQDISQSIFNATGLVIPPLQDVPRFLKGRDVR